MRRDMQGSGPVPAEHPGGAAGRLRPTGVPAHLVFFPAAILDAAVAIPAWAAVYRSRPELIPWHAHEMLFGFGLAVVAGFLLTGIGRRLLILLLATWLLARIAIPLGAAWAGGAGAIGFAILLAGTATGRFLRAARKGRNRIFGLVLAAMALAEAVWQAGAVGVIADGQARGTLLMLDLLTLLMLQMGGRVIPAATAGALYRRGVVLKDRVQPRVETAIGGLMAVVIACDQVPGWTVPLGAALVLAAALTTIRLARWRPWGIIGMPELWGLHLAYGWLAVGLALRGAAALALGIPPLAGVHALGIGGLGTLTAVMMARTAAARSLRRVPVPPWIGAVAALISISAALRIAAAFTAPALLIPGAAACWCLGFVILGMIHVRAM